MRKVLTKAAPSKAESERYHGALVSNNQATGRPRQHLHFPRTSESMSISSASLKAASIFVETSNDIVFVKAQRRTRQAAEFAVMKDVLHPHTLTLRLIKNMARLLQRKCVSTRLDQDRMLSAEGTECADSNVVDDQECRTSMQSSQKMLPALALILGLRPTCKTYRERSYHLVGI